MPYSPKPDQSPRLRLRVTAVAESILRGGHPWLFSDSVRDQNREGQSGELAVVYDRRDRFLAVGLYDPDSPLRLRVLHVGKPQALDLAWWTAHFRAALERRAGLFDEQTTGYRLIHGESDGWPGLVLDRYGSTHVLKLYTAAWLPHLDLLRGLLRDVLSSSQVVLRLSRNIQGPAAAGFNQADGEILLGTPTERNPEFLESGLRFEADVYRGQKTGFFLDQRENRRRVEALAGGAEVLNAFSYSGGFSLYAARGGARQVADLDISPYALAAGARNFDLNLAVPTIEQCRRDAIKADVFHWLRLNRERKFHLIVLDPPSLAKRAGEKEAALEAYMHLARHAVTSLHVGGVLVAASCSAHVTADEFFQAVKEGTNRRVCQELERTSHPPDHPATFAEAHYLKCLYLRVGGSR